MRLHLLVTCVSLAAGACAHATPQQLNVPDAAATTERNVIQFDHRDRFQLGPTTRICIETRIDPDVALRIEAAGEAVTTRHLTFRMSEAIRRQLRAAGLATYVGPSRQPRVSTYIIDPADRSCIDQVDNVLVRLRVGPAAAEDGYRVTLGVSQGTRRYQAWIERSALITLQPSAREGIPLEAEAFPGLPGPFWDVTRDAHRLSTAFVNHVFDEIEMRLELGS